MNELADGHDLAVPIQQTIDLGENATKVRTVVSYHCCGLASLVKLLRRLCDTIDMNTLAEGEECAICMEEMAVGECYRSGASLRNKVSI